MYERERTIDVLKRLKAQESRPNPEGYSYSKVIKQEPIKIVNIPQKNVEDAMKRVEEIKKKMKQGSQNYFSLYHDLKTAEDLFLKEANLIKSKNFQIPTTTMMRIDDMLKTIRSKEK